MKILITGASGFLGSWISRTLAKDHEVLAILRPASDDFNLRGTTPIQIIRRESNMWADVIRTEHPEVLVINDWWGVGSEDRNDPKQFENVSRHETLATVAGQAGISTVIGVGSQAELGPIGNEISDNQLDSPTTEYGKAKVATRISLQNILEGSNTRFIWMRIFSTYGALDSGNWLIPQTVANLSHSQEMDLTKGEQEWSYLHAFDLAKGFQLAMETPNIRGVVNIGNPDTVKIREVVEIIASLLGKSELLNFGTVAYRDDQVMKLKPLCEKLTMAGWIPSVELKAGLVHTINWLLGKPEIPLLLNSGMEINFDLPPRKV
jgi:nucleoside-diphosphate-sugar epimerase